MKRHLLLFVACSTWLCGGALARDASVSGTWVYVEGWHATRADVVPGQFTSPAVVLRFCQDGHFVMLKCMLYRQRHERTTIGADDGLQIYRGTWSHAPGGAIISYHLADAEISFTGYESVKKRQIKASARVSGDTLRMPVVRPFPPPIRDFPTTFHPKAKLPAPLEESFIDCGDHEKT